MRFLLVGGGILKDAGAIHRQINITQYDFILAVDHGFDHCRSLGLTPNLLMGDLDSIEEQRDPTEYRCEVRAFAPEKDETDLRLAVDYALSHGASTIDIICATGGRLDQFMGNLSLLEYMHAAAPTLCTRMIDERNVIRFLSPQVGRQQFQNRSKYLSIIPVSAELCFSGEGLKYPATQLIVTRTEMVSISNECTGDCYAITLHSGKALLIESKDTEDF
ncbi:MAG: thiamine diphosphokinase [Faecalibacterium sp.]